MAWEALFSTGLPRCEALRAGAWRCATCSRWEDAGEPALGDCASDRLSEDAGLSPCDPLCTSICPLSGNILLTMALSRVAMHVPGHLKVWQAFTS